MSFWAGADSFILEIAGEISSFILEIAGEISSLSKSRSNLVTWRN
jgi:hypothetical protein